jgi:hypothetical protein
MRADLLYQLKQQKPGHTVVACYVGLSEERSKFIGSNLLGSIHGDDSYPGRVVSESCPHAWDGARRRDPRRVRRWRWKEIEEFVVRSGLSAADEIVVVSLISLVYACNATSISFNCGHTAGERVARKLEQTGSCSMCRI